MEGIGRAENAHSKFKACSKHSQSEFTESNGTTASKDVRILRIVIPTDRNGCRSRESSAKSRGTTGIGFAVKNIPASGISRRWCVRQNHRRSRRPGSGSGRSGSGSSRDKPAEQRIRGCPPRIRSGRLLNFIRGVRGVRSLIMIRRTSIDGVSIHRSNRPSAAPISPARFVFHSIGPPSFPVVPVPRRRLRRSTCRRRARPRGNRTDRGKIEPTDSLFDLSFFLLFRMILNRSPTCSGMTAGMTRKP